MIHYRTGDATRPEGDGEKYIIHVCNDVGAWAAGFVLSLSARWSEPEDAYRSWARNRDFGDAFELGSTQTVRVAPDLSVVNMVAQSGLSGSGPPIRYEALSKCLASVAAEVPLTATIHAPRLGCGLAGGTWDRVSALLDERLGQHDVFVYDLPKSTS